MVSTNWPQVGKKMTFWLDGGNLPTGIVRYGRKRTLTQKANSHTLDEGVIVLPVAAGYITYFFNDFSCRKAL